MKSPIIDLSVKIDESYSKRLETRVGCSHASSLKSKHVELDNHRFNLSRRR